MSDEPEQCWSDRCCLEVQDPSVLFGVGGACCCAQMAAGSHSAKLNVSRASEMPLCCQFPEQAAVHAFTTDNAGPAGMAYV
jgi:hypothetical protein